jgi:NAD(P)-dependent dehydrogenase (short-subunit alcohol dehydrogenase family)
MVSGSTAGIGFAIAAALAGEGARVIVNGRSQAAVDSAVSKIKPASGGHVQGFSGDLSIAAAAEELVASGSEQWRRLGHGPLPGNYFATARITSSAY